MAATEICVFLVEIIICIKHIKTAGRQVEDLRSSAGANRHLMYGSANFIKAKNCPCKSSEISGRMFFFFFNLSGNLLQCD